MLRQESVTNCFGCRDQLFCAVDRCYCGGERSRLFFRLISEAPSFFFLIPLDWVYSGLDLETGRERIEEGNGMEFVVFAYLGSALNRVLFFF